MPEGPPARGRSAGELRIHGVNACLAVFAQRPEAIGKLWLERAQGERFGDVMRWCARNRIGYRLVDAAELERLTQTRHHEGVCMAVARAPEPDLAGWLATLPEGPALALWLDGVGNPHNLGAILRSAANFGVAGVLVPGAVGGLLSPAAARVAEGGAESVPLVRAGAVDDAVRLLDRAGFQRVATVVRGGDALFDAGLPGRCVLVMGAEAGGVSEGMLERCPRAVRIPGTGAVESLNVSAATAVLLAHWAQAHAWGGVAD